MYQVIIMLMLCSFLIVVPRNGMCKPDLLQTTEMQNESVDEIKISVNIRPIKDSEYCYNFSTNSKSQINYIVHLLNSMSLFDDEKVINGGDIPIVNINIIKENGMVDKIGFISGRFYDTKDKQYAVDKSEYSRFLDFVYALKTKEVVLEDEVTFEPSEWAKEDVEKAVKKELVPELNQINYRGKINRLEVCQLIDNLLNKQNIPKPESTENTFSDTTDKSVISLYNYGIIDGKNESEFDPYGYVTREELSKVLSNTYYLMNQKVQSDNCTHEYVDQKEISYWALNYVGDMYSLNIMIGNPENEFKPHANVTKEELIITLLRIYI